MARLVIPAGTTWVYEIPIIDEDGNPLSSLASWSARGQVRTNRWVREDPPLHQWTTLGSNPNAELIDSKLVLHVSADLSASWSWRYGYYNLELIDPDDRVARFMEGDVEVLADVTLGEITDPSIPPSPPSGEGGSGVSDHGQLTGLLDNDHTQYQLSSEKGAASGYASLDSSVKVPVVQLPTGTTSSNISLGDHAHDSRYFTEAEVNTLLAGKSGTSHNHDSSYYSESEVDGLVSNLSVEISGKSDLDHIHSVGPDINQLVYPLSGYGFHSATCAGESAQVQSSFSSWHTRVWVPAEKPITKVGLVLTNVGTVGVSGLNAAAFYSDDGQSLLGQTTDDDTWWTTSTGLQTRNLQSNISSSSTARFIRVIINVDGLNTSPSVCYCVPADDSGRTINGVGPLQRRSAYKPPYVGSFPSTIDPDTLGTPTNFIPFIVLG